MVSAGFVVGAKHGRGVATCRTGSGWSAPAFFDITGGSYGLQIGAQKVDLVMLIMNDKGMQHLLSSKFQLGGEAGVAAGPVGRQGTANTDMKMNAEVLTYSRAKGVFAGVDLSGASMKQDEDSTKAFYGKEVSLPRCVDGTGSSAAGGEVVPGGGSAARPAVRPRLRRTRLRHGI